MLLIEGATSTITVVLTDIVGGIQVEGVVIIRIRDWIIRCTNYIVKEQTMTRLLIKRENTVEQKGRYITISGRRIWFWFNDILHGWL